MASERGIFVASSFLSILMETMGRGRWAGDIKYGPVIKKTTRKEGLEDNNFQQKNLEKTCWIHKQVGMSKIFKDSL